MKNQTLMLLASKARTTAIALGMSAVAVASHAAAIDVEDVVTDIAAQAAPIAAIGGAVLLITVAIKAFKWVRRAL